MSDFNVHARIAQPQSDTTQNKLANKIGNLAKGNKKVTVDLVGKLGENDLYTKTIGKGIIVKDEKSFQKMMANHEFIPISMKLIQNNKEAGALQPKDVVFVKVDDLAKLRFGIYSDKLVLNKFSKNYITSVVPKSGGESGVQILKVKDEIKSRIQDEALFSHIRNTLEAKWDNPVEQSVLQETESFILQNPTIKLTPEQFESLVSTRTAGSTTFMDNPSKKNDWLNAEQFIRDKAEKKEDLSLEDIFKLNALVEGKDKCDLRDTNVQCGFCGPDYIHHQDIKPLMEKLLNEINAGCTNGENPIVLGAKGYQKMVSLHPFENGNGRTCRLVMDYILLRAGLPPPSLGTNVDVAIFGDQEREPKVCTPTNAVELIMEGLKATNKTVNK